MKPIIIQEKNVTYNIEERIRAYNANLDKKVYDFDQGKDESLYVGVGNNYSSLISVSSPSVAAVGVKDTVDN
jgi:hypothetical protein